MSFLGIDFGTTNVKGAAYSADGRLLAGASREYQTIRPRAGWAELNSQLMVDSAKEVIKEISGRVSSDPIRALSVSSLGEAMTPLSKDRKILGNAILAVADSRGAEYMDSLVERMGREELYRINPNIATANYSLPKLAWLRENESELFKRTDKFLLFGELLFYLFGLEAETSYSHANRTMLFDLEKEAWSEPILRNSGIDAAILPKPVPPGTILGTVPERVAAELGLKSPVACVVGAHDQCCNALGAGVIQSGRAVCGIGTVECVAPVYGSIPDKARMLDFGLNIEHHAIPGHYTSFIYNQAGSLVKWYRSAFARADLANAPAGTNVFALLDGEMPAEPTRLLVLPHFEPTGAPGFIQHSAGSVAGLTMDTTRGDILKAILECETFYFLDSLDTLKELGIDTAYFIATGGGSKSDPWLQIKSDIFGVPYERCVTPEAGVMGAAMIAAVAVGACASYAEAVDLFVKPGKVFEPDMHRHSFYREKYGQYRQLYPSLKKILAWTAAQPEGE